MHIYCCEIFDINSIIKVHSKLYSLSHSRKIFFLYVEF
jgi:hypothetical protein